MRVSRLLPLLLGGLIVVLVWQVASYRTKSRALAETIGTQAILQERLQQETLAGAGLETQSINPDWLWRASAALSPEQQLQAWALEAMRARSLSIRQYQQSQVPVEEDITTVGLRIEFSGPLSGLAQFLNDVESHRPLLGVANLQMRPLASRDQIENGTMIGGQIHLWGITGTNDAE